MHASLPALAAARAAHIAAACLHTPCIAERRLPLGPARKPEATRVQADQDHLFRGGPWHALSSLARAHARVPAHLSTRPVTAQPSCVPERLRTCQHAPQTAFFPAACVPLPARRVPRSRTPRRASHAPCMRPGGLGSPSPAYAVTGSRRASVPPGSTGTSKNQPTSKKPTNRSLTSNDRSPNSHQIITESSLTLAKTHQIAHQTLTKSSPNHH